MMKDLTELRKEIDVLDKQLIELLAERFRVTEQVGKFKAAHSLPAVDRTREGEQEKKVMLLAQKVGLDPAIAKRIQRMIIDEVVARHQQIMHDK